MDEKKTYLITLRSKVFKLLPMREAYDKGIDNHLDEYIEHLYVSYTGAFVCYPELSKEREIVEVYSNLAYLKDHISVEFNSWRSIVLRSTRLIQGVIKRSCKDTTEE